MSALSASDTIIVRGVPMRRDSAREACFTVVHDATEMRLSNDSSELSRRELLHRDVNNETQSLEISAQSLVDFPDAPWELRLHLARQCWDEARHARLFYRRFVEMGGFKGEFPIANHEWSVVCMLDSLPARFAIQNRTFEAGSLDALHKGIDTFRVIGDERMADIMETVLADEILHVRFANSWIKRMVQEDPRAALKIAAAMAYLRRVNAALSPRPGEVDIEGRDYGSVDHSVRTNTQDRAYADFTDDEIGELRRNENWEPSAAATADREQ
jgi:uncharacterized ferritin-like protein (DUF455 family)